MGKGLNSFQLRHTAQEHITIISFSPCLVLELHKAWYSFQTKITLSKHW